MEKTGEVGMFLLLEMTESMGRKDAWLEEEAEELLLLPLALPLDFRGEREELEDPGDRGFSLEMLELVICI